MPNSVTIPFGEGKTLTLETGRIARQAHGAVTATVGGTMVFAAVVRSPKAAENLDFFPLTVDYREKHYAVGRIPGNFFRRESRPSTMETITARLVDRAIRPMFPDGFNYEVQVHLTVLSMDQKHTTAVPALIAAAAALAISDIPFNGPVAAARIGRANDKFIVNPTFQQAEGSVLDLVVAGTKPAICMVESGSECLSEETILEALQLAQESIAPVIDGINDLVAQCGKPKIEFTASEIPAEIVAAVNEATKAGFEVIGQTYEKKARETAVEALETEVKAKLATQFTDEKAAKQIAIAFEDAYKKYVREQVLGKSLRADGRKLDEIRPITVETQFLPMAHGSAIFTRGQTQSLGVATLGTVGDQQKIDDLMGVSNERFLLHYNFPSYSVGEVRRISGPGRRELGHGMLAQRALAPILPPADKFPYTIRLVSEIMESNGSSSMASVCSGCLSLMDAGVPILAPVAGIAMGMIKDGDRLAVLSDIMGMEDHLGDMD
ncbi:TPA: polyribonucleotide nucleotidyltransferase, partial [Candidatus Sumerlaeota bacterium]|nr:polyribonucleotide nucleotidyltransferase [Candidatus Sumerlaeota bacterium]